METLEEGEQKRGVGRGQEASVYGVGEREGGEEDVQALPVEPVREVGEGAESQVLHHATLRHHAHLLARLLLTFSFFPYLSFFLGDGLLCCPGRKGRPAGM